MTPSEIEPATCFELTRKWGRSWSATFKSRKISLANLKIWCSQMQPFSRNRLPDLQTCLTHMSLVLHLPREVIEMHPSLQILFNRPTCAIMFAAASHNFCNCYITLAFCSLFARCRISCACHTKLTIEHPPCHSMGGVNVVHFVVNQSLAQENGNGTNSPADKMVWP